MPRFATAALHRSAIALTRSLAMAADKVKEKDFSGWRENYDSLVMFDNVPSIYIGINGTTDGNPLTTIKLVNAELEKLKKSFPPGLNAAVAYDSTEFIQASINEVIVTLLQACLIVIMVIFLFLGSYRSTLIPLTTIPLSIVGVLFYMQVMGYSINLLTLLAMVMAIGLLVDDAILVATFTLLI